MKWFQTAFFVETDFICRPDSVSLIVVALPFITQIGYDYRFCFTISFFNLFRFTILMTEHISAPSPSPVGEDYLLLGQYAERAYLEYAMSVVKGRALPEVSRRPKACQRRILFAMRDMGLTAGAKPVKSARVVGEILGKYHPHGDSSAY